MTDDQPTAAPLRQVSAGCLSEDAGFRLLVEGTYRPREIDLIIRSLRITQEALREPVPAWSYVI